MAFAIKTVWVALLAIQSEDAQRMTNVQRNADKRTVMTVLYAICNRMTILASSSAPPEDSAANRIVCKIAWTAIQSKDVQTTPSALKNASINAMTVVCATGGWKTIRMLESKTPAMMTADRENAMRIAWHANHATQSEDAKPVQLVLDGALVTAWLAVSVTKERIKRKTMIHANSSASMADV